MPPRSHSDSFRPIRHSLLILTSAALLTLSFAPFSQFYLAHIALVPLLLAVRDSRTPARSLWPGLLLGMVFYTPNLAWLRVATLPGFLLLSIYASLSLAIVTFLTRPTLARLALTPAPLACLLALVTFPTIFTSVEFLRSSTYPHLPWLLLAHTQSPNLPLLQLADATGTPGITFVVAASNAMAYLLLTVRPLSTLKYAAVATLALHLLTLSYGTYRLRQFDPARRPGPTVTLVQLNHLHRPGGISPLSRAEAANSYLAATRASLVLPQTVPHLIVFPESALPPLNPEALENLRRSPVGPQLQSLHDSLLELCSTNNLSILAGASYVGDWTPVGSARVASDIRNSAFLFTPTGQSPLRYDKIRLVPFAETLPFTTHPLLHRFALSLAAATAAQPDHPGDPANLTTFPLGPYRAVSPICFENTDPSFIRSLLAPDPSRPSGKRADLIVNLTNDGWFNVQEHYQHLQNILFRAVETRTPIARCANTGISAFISSDGRILDAAPLFTDRTLTRRLPPDPRIPPYLLIGDAFAYACCLATPFLLAFSLRSRTPVK